MDSSRLYTVEYSLHGRPREALVRSKSPEEAQVIVEQEYFAHIDNRYGVRVHRVSENEYAKGILYDVPREVQCLEARPS